MPDDAPPLRVVRARLGDVARSAGKPLYVVEKDYALSYLLAGIFQVDTLRESLIFKGGTCLRKAYFAGYRFSEDLDFTSRSPIACDALLSALQEAGRVATQLLETYGPFSISVEEERHRDPHPRGQCSFRIRVQFPWMRTPNCSLKVEVTAQEPLLGGTVERPLIHEFPGEPLEATLLSYRLEEVATEKLRALLQARQHLDEQGWLRNRPRDLYDLDYLWRQREYPIDWQAVAKLLPVKAQAYGVTYEGPETFLDATVLDGIEGDWQGQLSNFVVELPTFEACRTSLSSILEAVFRSG